MLCEQFFKISKVYINYKNVCHVQQQHQFVISPSHRVNRTSSKWAPSLLTLSHKKVFQVVNLSRLSLLAIALVIGHQATAKGQGANNGTGPNRTGTGRI